MTRLSHNHSHTHSQESLGCRITFTDMKRWSTSIVKRQVPALNPLEPRSRQPKPGSSTASAEPELGSHVLPPLPGPPPPAGTQDEKHHLGPSPSFLAQDVSRPGMNSHLLLALLSAGSLCWHGSPPTMRQKARAAGPPRWPFCARGSSPLHPLRLRQARPPLG